MASRGWCVRTSLSFCWQHTFIHQKVWWWFNISQKLGRIAVEYCWYAKSRFGKFVWSMHYGSHGPVCTFLIWSLPYMVTVSEQDHTSGAVREQVVKVLQVLCVQCVVWSSVQWQQLKLGIYIYIYTYRYIYMYTHIPAHMQRKCQTLMCTI